MQFNPRHLILLNSLSDIVISQEEDKEYLDLMDRLYWFGQISIFSI